MLYSWCNSWDQQAHQYGIELIIFNSHIFVSSELRIRKKRQGQIICSDLSCSFESFINLPHKERFSFCLPPSLPLICPPTPRHSVCLTTPLPQRIYTQPDTVKTCIRPAISFVHKQMAEINFTLNSGNILRRSNNLEAAELFALWFIVLWN